MELDYTRIDSLSEDSRDLLTQFCSADGVEPWSTIGRTDTFWFLTVLLEEKPSCMIGVSRPIASPNSACPITEIATDAGLHVVVDEDESETHVLRHIFVSSNAESAATVNTLWSHDQRENPDHEAIGRALGYPEEAVQEFEATNEQDVLQFIVSETAIPAEDARYVYSCPYIPKLTVASVQTAIECGKYFAAIPQQLVEDRPEFGDLPASKCPLPIPVEKWGSYVEHVISTTDK